MSLGVSPKDVAAVKAVNGADSEDDTASKQCVDMILRFSSFDIGLSLRSNLVNKGTACRGKTSPSSGIAQRCRTS